MTLSPAEVFSRSMRKVLTWLEAADAEIEPSELIDGEAQELPFVSADIEEVAGRMALPFEKAEHDESPIAAEVTAGDCAIACFMMPTWLAVAVA